MKIALIGTGYVGLGTGTCLADSGNDVAGRLGVARFFAEHMAVASGGLEREVIGGADAILAAQAALAG